MSAAVQEIPLSFDCAGAALVGMVHRPEETAGRLGVLIVVGGPQYRVGSHRQFLLLARALAEAGIPAMRFDHRGMGDSGGRFAGFEAIGDDIRAAADAFMEQVPEMDGIVLWGLCDAASAILFYAADDPRIAGAAILNPWVRSEAGYARTQLRHYYLGQLVSRDFWGRLLSGRIALLDSLGSFLGIVRKATAESDAKDGAGEGGNPLAARMATGLCRFARPTLLIVSGRDLTAREFEDAAAASADWQGLMEGAAFARRDLPAADHTFSRRAWRDQVAAWTREWVEELS